MNTDDHVYARIRTSHPQVWEGYAARHDGLPARRKGGFVMFGFLSADGSRKPSPALERALVERGLLSSYDVTALRVLTQSGGYAGRGVQYFRVFDPRQANPSTPKIRKYTDLDAHPRLILALGHIDQRGVVYLTKPEPSTATRVAAPQRVPAPRGDHADDEHLVFPGGNESTTA